MTNEKNDDQEKKPKCVAGCACHAGSAANGKWFAGVIVLAIAGTLVFRAIKNDQSNSTASSQSGFGSVFAGEPMGSFASNSASAKTVQSVDQKERETSPRQPNGSASTKAFICGEPISSLSELNSKAMDKNSVFIFLPGDNESKNTEIKASLEKVRDRLQQSIKIGIFTLLEGSPEYKGIAIQVPPPGVIVIAKGLGNSAVTGDIGETKLMQALFAASKPAGGCGSGCGSSGCGL